MAVAQDPVLMAAIIDRVRRVVDPRQVILFGSRARGDAREDSDIDLLVVLDAPPMDRFETALRIRSALSDIRASKDIVVVTVDELSRLGKVRSTLQHAALNEGTVLYARS